MVTTLPPLPEPVETNHYTLPLSSKTVVVGLYSADQMYAFYQAGRESMREAIMGLLHEYDDSTLMKEIKELK